jgi:hypothetical protein
MNNMKSIHYFLSLFAITFISISVFAQSADEIIAKHIEAVGGKEKLSGLNSTRFEISIEAGGAGASGFIVTLNGKGYRNEADWSGQKVIQVYTDKNGWAQNQFIGINDPQAMTDAQYKSGMGQIYIVPLLNYAARGDKAELAGQEKIGNVMAYKIKMTNKDNNVVTYFFDPTTFYLLQSISTTDLNGQPTNLIVKYSDYKKTDYGWIIPYINEISFGEMFSMTATITKVEINNPVDATTFEMKK